MPHVLVAWRDVKYELENKRTAVLDYGWLEIDREMWVEGLKYVVWQRGVIPEPTYLDDGTEVQPAPVYPWTQLTHVDDLLELKCWLTEKGYLLPE